MTHLERTCYPYYRSHCPGSEKYFQLCSNPSGHTISARTTSIERSCSSALEEFYELHRNSRVTSNNKKVKRYNPSGIRSSTIISIAGHFDKFFAKTIGFLALNCLIISDRMRNENGRKTLWNAKQNTVFMKC